MSWINKSVLQPSTVLCRQQLSNLQGRFYLLEINHLEFVKRMVRGKEVLSYRRQVQAIKMSAFLVTVLHASTVSWVLICILYRYWHRSAAWLSESVAGVATITFPQKKFRNMENIINFSSFKLIYPELDPMHFWCWLFIAQMFAQRPCFNHYL